MMRENKVEYYSTRYGILEGYNQRTLKIVKLMANNKQKFGIQEDVG